MHVGLFLSCVHRCRLWSNRRFAACWKTMKPGCRVYMKPFSIWNVKWTTKAPSKNWRSVEVVARVFDSLLAGELLSCDKMNTSLYFGIVRVGYKWATRHTSNVILWFTFFPLCYENDESTSDILTASIVLNFPYSLLSSSCLKICLLFFVLCYPVLPQSPLNSAAAGKYYKLPIFCGLASAIVHCCS